MKVYKESNFQVEYSVVENSVIVSETNLKGVITSVNNNFVEISGYKEEELLGNNHNIIRHPDVPKIIFKELWASLEREGKWIGIVKNLRKDKSYYWVKVMILPIYDKDSNKKIGYKSVRTSVSFEEKLEAQRNYDLLKIKTGDAIRKVIYEKENLKEVFLNLKK
jgi:aerotaxis receptor